MSEVDPWIWFAILGIAAAVPVAAATAVYRTVDEGRLKATAAVGGIFAGWLLLVLALGGAGVFRADADARAPFIGAGVAVPIIAGVILLRTGAMQRLASSIPQTWLLAAQAPRVLGVAFLVLAAQDKLPVHFALPAGLGDIAIGVAGLLVAWYYARRLTHSHTLAVAFNAVGILDLVVAVGTGFLSAPSPLRVFMSEPSTQLMTVLPMVLVPAFLLPTFFLVHLLSLGKLAGERSATPRASARLQPLGR